MKVNKNLLINDKYFLKDDMNTKGVALFSFGR